MDRLITRLRQIPEDTYFAKRNGYWFAWNFRWDKPPIKRLELGSLLDAIEVEEEFLEQREEPAHG